MKSIKELSRKLAQQWQSAQHREQRLLKNYSWPIRLSIGRPSADEVKNQSAKVQTHLKHWRAEKLGQIEWTEVSYQSMSQTVKIPDYWLINSPSEWIEACQSKNIQVEFDQLSLLVSQTDGIFHPLWLRQRSLWQNKEISSIIKCAQVAMQITPGMAQGRPLRALSIDNIDNIDTKFLENHRSLLLKLLNIRYSKTEEISPSNHYHIAQIHLPIDDLEQFLGAADDKNQWLLILPLDPTLLPYKQLRLRASELATIPLPASHLVIIENEQCHYQLPKLKNTIAILGAGLNLKWLNNVNFNTKKIAYWGDIDSWGLKMLAMARQAQPQLNALLMGHYTFIKYQEFSVIEPQSASKMSPPHLNNDERQLYQQLIHACILTNSLNNRLEQEFIPEKEVHQCLSQWHQSQ